MIFRGRGENLQALLTALNCLMHFFNLFSLQSLLHEHSPLHSSVNVQRGKPEIKVALLSTLRTHVQLYRDLVCNILRFLNTDDVP